MDFNLSEDHLLVQEAAREFCEKRLMPVAAEADEKEALIPELIKEMGDLGFLGMIIPEEYGGAGMDSLSYVVALEELARGCASHALVMGLSNSLFGYPVMTWGTEAQKKKYLPPVCSGDKIGAFAITEPAAGSDVGGMRMTAVKDGDDYILSGTKTFITMGSLADFSLVVAATDREKRHKGLTAFLVDHDLKGFQVGTIEKKMGLKGSPTAELIYDEVRVPKSAVLGEEGIGFRIAMQTLDGGRASVGAMATGMAVAAHEAALKYATERRQFGRPIADFQAIQFMLADMATSIETARLITHKAAWLKDNNLPASKEAAMAKLYASEVATDVADKAIQILGGYGYMKEFHVERHYRDARVTRIFEGTSEIQRLVIARSLLKELQG